MIDRVSRRLGRPLVEVPVGFKWFVSGLADGSLGFAGEESAGATLLRRDGTTWTTDKDGLALGLLAAEITAQTGHDPAARYATLTREFGESHYARIDVAATAEQMAALKAVSSDAVSIDTLAGQAVVAKSTTSPGGHPFGGLKVSATDGWFAVRPSGTEAIYKIYAESFRSAEHLCALQDDAQAVVDGLI